MRERQKEKLRGNKRRQKRENLKGRREKNWQEEGVVCSCGACRRRSDPSGRMKVRYTLTGRPLFNPAL